MVIPMASPRIPSAEAPSPSKEQLQAAARFAKRHGRRLWKTRMRSLWMGGSSRRYGASADEAAFLQQLRNECGPLWLNAVRFDRLICEGSNDAA